MCTKNGNHMMYASWDMEYNRHKFLTFWAIFCLYTPLLSPKIKIWNKFKKTSRYYPITHVYHKWRLHDVWFLRHKARQTEFFIILGHFLPFNLPNNLKNQNFEKMKKNIWTYFILHLHTTNDNHMMYGSWETNFLVILDYFVALLHPNNMKN